MSSSDFLTFPNGLKMPIVGYGTYAAEDEAEFKVALRTALDAGYRHFDAALLYGNEHVIGQVLQEYFKAGKLRREDIFITTKLWGNYMTSKALIRKGIERSLKNLQLEYVDLYLVHHPMGRAYEGEENLLPTNPDGSAKLANPDLLTIVWRGMEDLVTLGLAKSIGVSNYNSKQIEYIHKNARIPIANNQVEAHVFLQQHKLVEFCQARNITVTAYGPLGASAFFARSSKAEDSIPLKHPDVLRIAQKHGKGAGHILLKFLIQRGIAVVPKSVTPKRIVDNFNLFDFELDQNDMSDLVKLDRNSRFFTQDLDKGLEDHPEYPFKLPF